MFLVTNIPSPPSSPSRCLVVDQLEAKFLCIQVEELIQALPPSKLAGVAYHPAQCAHLAAVLSAEIQDPVKAVTPPCYKLVCSGSIGSKGQDDVAASSQNPWDLHADSYVNPTLFCVVLVHVIYLERAL